jgi:hypothetical protein
MNITAWLLLWLKICGIAMAIIGWGYLGTMCADVLSREKSNLIRFLGPFEFGIVGFGLVYVYALAVSVFAPLGVAAHCTFVLFGIVGFAWMAWSLLRLSRPAWQNCVWVAALTAFVTYGMSHTRWNYDAGLYHLQAVSYFQQGAAPVGIANIHHRLGFNSSWFPISALSAGPVFGREGLFLVNAAAAIVFLGALLSSGLNEWRSKRFGATGAYAASVLLMFVSSGTLFAEWFALSPSPDLPSALSCTYAFFCFLALAGILAATTKESENTTDLGRYILLLVSSAVLATTAKTSQLPILFLIGVLWWQPQAIRHRILPRQYRAALFLGALMALAWIVQGIMASGCLLFPVGMSCLGFLPWAVEQSKAKLALDLILTWNKAPYTPIDQIPAGLAWLPLWHDKMLRFREFVFILAWVAAGLQLLGWVTVVIGRNLKPNSRGSTPTRLGWTFVPALTVSVVGILYWFFGAPDPRFGLGFLVATPCLTFAFMASLGLKQDSPGGLQRVGVPSFAALILIAFGTQLYELYHQKGALSVWRHEPEPRVSSVVNAAGLTVRIPVEGNQCWNTKPPCTPEPVDGLHQSSVFGHVMYFHSRSAGSPAAR